MKEWKCKDCCCFESDNCPYPYVQEHYNACSRVVIQHDEAYQQGRTDAIDEYKQRILSTCLRECIKCNFCKDETCDIAFIAEQLKEEK